MGERERKEEKMSSDHDYKSKIRFRNSCIHSKHEMTTAIDKTILSLSGGALIISFTFLNIYPDPNHAWLLLVSWILLAISILFVIFSFRTSEESFQTQINEIDASIEEERGFNDSKIRGGPWGVWTKRFNWASLISFFVGVIGLIIFCNSNISNLNHNKRSGMGKLEQILHDTTSTINIYHTGQIKVIHKPDTVEKKEK